MYSKVTSYFLVSRYTTGNFIFYFMYSKVVTIQGTHGTIQGNVVYCMLVKVVNYCYLFFYIIFFIYNILFYFYLRYIILFL